MVVYKILKEITPTNMENKQRPAFARPATGQNDTFVDGSSGLTKLEYASIVAMQTFIEKCAPDTDDNGDLQPNYELIAGCSVGMAKALLTELEK